MRSSGNMMSYMLFNMRHFVASHMATNMSSHIGDDRAKACCAQNALQAGYQYGGVVMTGVTQ